ncbi:PREDICTED: SRC kinase signaling inhibitor 1-like [Nanorana parkeri]|uniref:SRC kinase signaling inhibitor 1-like n=1 Tax=Nanorana parkeri TaxID=125878 RepID=UPI0008547A9E|nr:PREDICTED: SRC kinase signaling inhibitor 1-like [Nanorana parkeri]
MGNTPSQDSSRSGSHMISADDAEYPREYRTLGNGTRRFSNVGLVHTSERRHTVIAAQSLEALTNLQKSDMDRKRDAFMDHLKNKYPQHALAIRGQQERIRDQLLQGSSPILLAGSPEALMYRETQENAVPVCLDNPSSQPNYWSFKTRSSRHSQSSQPGLADQAAKLSFASAESLETMSEAELPLGFNRMNRFRQSLPLSRSTSQTKLRSPGVLFLQYGDETRRVHITHEITSMDTLHALIVHMFQQKLTMGMLKSHNTAILIKDESRNVFYELEDVRDIQDRSIIKIYRKEPIYSSFPAPHITNGDVRREMMYSSRDSSPTRRLNNISPAPHLASSSPPPVLQSSSPARSRMSYSGGRPPSYAGSPVHHGDRMSGLPPAHGVSPSPSAILERRDVKPDEDLSNKNVVLVKNEGLYSDPYGMVHEGRLSITSTQSLAGLGDPFSYPGGLYKRGSVRSLSTYSAAALQTDLEDGMYKPNSQIYGDTYGPGMGFRIPPSSPQKVSDGRMVDIQQSQGPHSPYSGPSSRNSPVRQTFRKDSSSSVFMDSPVGKQRNPSSSSGTNDIFSGPERPLSGFSSPVPAKETETRERMEAMEKQIASLTGLVQSALMRSSDSENTRYGKIGRSRHSICTCSGEEDGPSITVLPTGGNSRNDRRRGKQERPVVDSQTAPPVSTAFASRWTPAMEQHHNWRRGKQERPAECTVTCTPCENFPSLDKDGDLDVFLRSFEKTCRQYELPKDQWAKYLTPGLKGPALQAVSELPVDHDQDYETIKAALQRRYYLTPSECSANVNMQPVTVENKREKLFEALRPYSTVFTGKPGRTHLVTHHIDTEDHHPLRQVAYRVSPEVKADIKREIEEMLELGVMPFGMKNAPATFKRLVNHAGAYLDDIAVFSDTWDERLLPLAKVLDRISAAELTIKPDSWAWRSEKTEATTGDKTACGHQNAGTPLFNSGSSSTPADQSKAITRLHMQLHLHDLQHNASELKNQLQQLKKLQLQNQETVRNMLKRTETEISVRVTDTIRRQEDPLQRQRAMVEEERLKYLNEEELITQQLNDLEKSVEKIKKDIAHNHRLISVQELEEKAVVLKQLGETLTDLKAQFPSLQSKMRVVLRVEVEAVKFLKEEPLRLDGLLKRCKTVTDTLAQIRKYDGLHFFNFYTIINYKIDKQLIRWMPQRYMCIFVPIFCLRLNDNFFCAGPKVQTVIDLGPCVCFLDESFASQLSPALRLKPLHFLSD